MKASSPYPGVILRSLVIMAAALWTAAAAVATEQGLVKVSVANIRVHPRHPAELASQALMGTPVLIHERQGDWLRVETPDGYAGWMSGSSVACKSDGDMERWRKSRRAVVTATEAVCRSTPELSGSRDAVSDLVSGCIVELTGEYPTAGAPVEIMLPDGRKAWVDPDVTVEMETWSCGCFDSRKITDTAYALLGRPYLWGGTSAKSTDCSGLVKVCYLACGLIVPRDASQQAAVGRIIPASDWQELREGDLVMFGNADGTKVTHVGIYDRDGLYVHCSGEVKQNSVDPQSPLYNGRRLLFGVSYRDGAAGDAVKAVHDHPWYFRNDAGPAMQGRRAKQD